MLVIGKEKIAMNRPNYDLYLGGTGIKQIRRQPFARALALYKLGVVFCLDDCRP
jgi:hypothetical protein